LKQAPDHLRGRPVRLLFQDEGRFGRINDTRRCWAPLPTRPVVGQQVVREYLYSFVAVCPYDGQFTSLTLPWIDAHTMSIFLAHTAQQFADEYGLMFLDGAGWHHAQNLRVPENLKLIFLPPYSPELNPAEHVWDYLRENHFGNDALASLEEVADRLAVGLQTLAAQPDLVRSLTLFDWIKTINLTLN
jgi:hypothetical protein